MGRGHGGACGLGLRGARAVEARVARRRRRQRQGLTLVHISAQLEPCLTHKPALHTLSTP